MPYSSRISQGTKISACGEDAVNFYEQVYRVVRQIPAGKVVTYGQVASLLGQPRAARAVGYALRFLPPDADVPWHRVINHQGQISLRYPVDSPLLQRLLLEEEGVMFDAAGRVDLAVYRWLQDVASSHEEEAPYCP
jgi:methylated-DNA-protein-cysteine methyltransferase related protein